MTVSQRTLVIGSKESHVQLDGSKGRSQDLFGKACVFKLFMGKFGQQTNNTSKRSKLLTLKCYKTSSTTISRTFITQP